VIALTLSLVAATAYGLSDFVGGVLSKRAGPWSVALVGQLAGAVIVLALTAVTTGTPTAADLGWAVVAGVGNGLGTAFLYRGFAAGRMGVVAPVSGVGAALLPVAVGLVTGERPGTWVWVGVVAALPGIWLVAREPGAGDVPGPPARATGVADGVLAGLGFGTLFVALAQIPDGAGFLPLALNQLVAAAVVVLAAVALRSPWVPRSRSAAAGVATGALGALATGAFLLATQQGLLVVTAVLTSLYPAVTVLLAAGLLREHVHRAQAVGLVLCGVAVAFVAAG
jgi:drug/metabolite transporter (DMT)-like permease